MPHLVATLICLSQMYLYYIRGDRSPLIHGKFQHQSLRRFIARTGWWTRSWFLKYSMNTQLALSLWRRSRLRQNRRQWPTLICQRAYGIRYPVNTKSYQLISGSILATVSDARPALSIHMFNVIRLSLLIDNKPYPSLLPVRNEMNRASGHFCAHIWLNWTGEPPEDGEMTLPSTHRIRNSNSGDLRPSLLPPVTDAYYSQAVGRSLTQWRGDDAQTMVI